MLGQTIFSSNTSASGWHGPWLTQSDTTDDPDKEDSECKKKEESDNNQCCDEEQKGEAGEPVYLYNGKFYYKRQDLSLSTKIPLNIIFYYDSMSSYNTAWGYGWAMSYNWRIYKYNNGKLLLQKGNNNKTWYIPVGTTGRYVPQAGYFDSITLNTDGTYTLAVKNNRHYEFSSKGYLSSIHDLNNNELRMTYKTDDTDTVAKQYITGISPYSNKTTPIVVAMDYQLIKIEEYSGGATTGKYVEFTYDDTGRANKITDNAGREVLYAYSTDYKGDLTTVMDPEGNTYDYTYDTDHKMLTFVGMGCSDCSLHSNAYDDNGRVTQQAHGNKTVDILYSDDQTMTETITSVYNDTTLELIGTKIEYYYFNSQGYVTNYTIQMGDELDTSIGASETDDIVTQFTYTSLLQTETKTDPLGNVTTYTYDGNNNITKEETAYTDGKVITKTYTFDSTLSSKTEAQITSNFDTNTYKTQYTYDTTTGNMLTETQYITDTETKTTTYTHNTDGTIATIKDPNGNATSYTYDSYGQLLASTIDTSTTTYTYDTYGNRASITDANGNTTTYTYDKLNRPTTITDPLGNQTIYSYTNSNLTQIEEGKTTTEAGHITKYEYDDLNRKTAVTKTTTSGDITIASYTYDSEGNILTVADGNSNTTDYAHDALNRKTSETDALGYTTTYGYDKLSNLTSMTDANGNTTTYTYNPRSQLSSVTQTDGSVTSYTYNTLGNVLTITDAKSQMTTNVYDKIGRLASTINPLSKTTSYQYDDNDNLIQKQDPNGNTITYTYNNYNQLTTITYPDHTVSLTYDNAGNLLTYTDGTTSGSYVYDSLNRATSVTTTYSFGSKTVSYTYNRFGNKSTATYPDTGTLTYNYDDLNRLTSMSDTSGTVVSYSYDNASRLITKTLENDTVSTYSYDNANRLSSITNPNITYTHDNVGNRRTKTNTDGVHTYNYDDICRLTSADNPDAIGDESYSYDNVGNRLTNEDYTDWTYNAGNQLTNYNSTTFTFDNNGNTTTKTDAEGTTTYAWDCENRLLSATRSTLSASFYCDPFGKRLSKTVDGVTTWYLYDNEDIVAEYDSAGTLLRSYIHGLGIDEPIRITIHDSPSTSYYYLADGLGSITEMQDSTGNTVEKYSYDSFGNVTIKDGAGNTLTESSINNSYMFCGYWYDEETELYNCRNRYYDTRTGRFISEDPIGFEGDTNFYTYVGNNAINYIDPYGLKAGHPFGWPKGLTCHRGDGCPRVIFKSLGWLILITLHLNNDYILKPLGVPTPNGKPRITHSREISDLMNGLANCISLIPIECKCGDRDKGRKAKQQIQNKLSKINIPQYIPPQFIL